MARPIKNNCDYFSHDANMRNDRKIKALRTKFGLDGYAVFCMMLEVLTDAEFLRITLDEIELELLLGDFGVNKNQFEEILSYLFTLNLLQKEDNIVFCKQLQKRLQPVFDKRNRAKQKFLSQKPEDIISSDAENTQSKEEDIKENKNIEKEKRGIESVVNQKLVFTKSEAEKISKQNGQTDIGCYFDSSNDKDFILKSFYNLNGKSIIPKSYN